VRRHSPIDSALAGVQVVVGAWGRTICRYPTARCGSIVVNLWCEAQTQKLGFSLRGSSYVVEERLRKVTCRLVLARRWDRVGSAHSPTFELASVSELRVVDLPLDGLPTRPISGSRGILFWGGDAVKVETNEGL